MTDESLFEYIANVFYPWVVQNKTKFRIVLFLDGHASHLTIAFSAKKTHGAGCTVSKCNSNFATNECSGIPSTKTGMAEGCV